jgi:hypothetical protein
MQARWIQVTAVWLVFGGAISTTEAVGQPAENVQNAFNTMREALEARDIKAVMQRVAPDFILERGDGTRLNRRQFERVWDQTLLAMADLKVTFSPPFPFSSRSEVTFTTDFHFDGHTQPAPLPLTRTRLESGAIRTVFANPQHQRHIVYVGSVEQTWMRTRQGWKLKRQRILQEKKTVDPRPFTLPLQPGGAADREVETLTPTPAASETDSLFEFNARPVHPLLLTRRRA